MTSIVLVAVVVMLAAEMAVTSALAPVGPTLIGSPEATHPLKAPITIVRQLVLILKV